MTKRRERPPRPGAARAGKGVEGSGKVALIDVDLDRTDIPGIREVTAGHLLRLDSCDALDDLNTSSTLEEIDDTSEDLLEHHHDWKVVQEVIGEMSFEVTFGVPEPVYDDTGPIEIELPDAVLEGEPTGTAETRKREAAILARAISTNLARHLSTSALGGGEWLRIGTSYFADDQGDDRAKMYFAVRRRRLLAAVGLRYERGRVASATADVVFEGPPSSLSPPPKTTAFREVRRGDGYSRYLARYVLLSESGRDWEGLGIQVQWGIIRFLMEILTFAGVVGLARGELSDDTIHDVKVDIGDVMHPMARLRELAREKSREPTSPED